MFTISSEPVMDDLILLTRPDIPTSTSDREDLAREYFSFEGCLCWMCCPAKLRCRALLYRRTPYLATFQIRPPNLTKLKEREYKRGTVVSKDNLSLIDIKNWHKCSSACWLVLRANPRTDRWPVVRCFSALLLSDRLLLKFVVEIVI